MSHSILRRAALVLAFVIPSVLAACSGSDPVDPGGRRTLSFRAPQEPGEYEVYCPMGNHRGRGMTANLVVR